MPREGVIPLTSLSYSVFIFQTMNLLPLNTISSILHTHNVCLYFFFFYYATKIDLLLSPVTLNAISTRHSQASCKQQQLVFTFPQVSQSPPPQEFCPKLLDYLSFPGSPTLTLCFTCGLFNLHFFCFIHEFSASWFKLFTEWIVICVTAQPQMGASLASQLPSPTRSSWNNLSGGEAGYDRHLSPWNSSTHLLYYLMFSF